MMQNVVVLSFTAEHISQVFQLSRSWHFTVQNKKVSFHWLTLRYGFNYPVQLEVI